jgi:hypothetical protein
MSLTGIPLILAVALGVVVSAAVTVVAWRRDWRPRLLVRPLGVLLIEALVLAEAGLVANRIELFYPSWADLLQRSGTPATTVAVRAGALDEWLRLREPHDGDAFAWHPDGWTRWHLAEAPTILAPPGYLQNPGRRYSVVVVIGDEWTTPPGGAEQTIVVFARTTAATTAATLSEALPARLSHDLRVTGHRWALVCPASALPLAGQAAATPGRYPAIAVVRDRRRSSAPDGAVTAAPVATGVPHTPVGVTVSVLGGLTDAVAWAAGQTPPPLAESAPPVARLPVHRHPHRRSASGSAATRTGGNRVAGQPRL